MNQNKTKLTQELQQSKKDYNVLQADVEKVTYEKNMHYQAKV